VFKKYLVFGDNTCTTRPLVATSYEVVEEVYRYAHAPARVLLHEEVGGLKRWLRSIYEFFCSIPLRLGIRELVPDAYTLVLKKGSGDSEARQ
jgi:hypothetical protein